MPGSSFAVIDWAGNPPPFRNIVTNVLPNDVEVGFRLCLSGEVTTGDVCVIGSNVAVGNRGSGVVMNSDGGDLYGVAVVFPAGSNPTFEYKYKKDDCQTWEGTPNRLFTLDNGTALEIALTGTWEDGAGACGPVAVEKESWGGLKSLYR